MLLSMTGYGNDIYSNNKFSFETEVRSLNSRFLDLSIKLPRELHKHEFAVRDFIKNKIIRGKISLSVNLTLSDSFNNEIELNQNELSKIISLLNKIKSAANSSENLSLNQILLFKDNLVEHLDKVIEIEQDMLLDSITRAIDNLIDMRGKEGAQLKDDLDQRIKNIGLTLEEISKKSKNATTEYFQKFKDRAKKLYDEFVDDQERFQIELAILTEKHDITEECIRLQSHIKLFNETLLDSYDIGRKLNFICQEMNREVNTINSKSISSEISHLGISIKEELEKIREQVQNIE